MEFFGNIIKGIMIGIANIIPGVSGGTMAVSLGIYDRLIGSISGLFREFKKSILFLIPIIIGAGIGIVGFTYAIEYLRGRCVWNPCLCDRLCDLRRHAAFKGEQGCPHGDRGDSGEYGDLIYPRYCGFCHNGNSGCFRLHDADDLRLLLRDHQYDQDIP